MSMCMVLRGSSGVDDDQVEETRGQAMFAVPMIATNMSYYAITLVSVMFAGHLGDVKLAGATLGNSWGTVTGLMPNSELSTSLVAMCVNTEAITYMITFGFSAVVSTRVSNEMGAGNVEKAKVAVAVTLKLLSILPSSCCCNFIAGCWSQFVGRLLLQQQSDYRKRVRIHSTRHRESYQMMFFVWFWNFPECVMHGDLFAGD